MAFEEVDPITRLINYFGSYGGTSGTSCGVLYPGSRYAMVMYNSVLTNSVFMFGGKGYSASPSGFDLNIGYLADTWEFDFYLGIWKYYSRAGIKVAKIQNPDPASLKYTPDYDFDVYPSGRSFGMIIPGENSFLLIYYCSSKTRKKMTQLLISK